MADTRGQQQIYRASAKIRDDWTQMVSAFHNRVTSGFGVFSDLTRPPS